MRILVTGSVGAGKTTATQMLVKQLTNFVSFNLSDVVIQNKLYETIDEAFDTHIPDDDKLMDYIRDNINPIPNFIIDHHSFDIFGNVYFDVVIVVTCIDKDQRNYWTLRRRLEQRGYSEKKIQENLEVEIMGVVKEEVKRFKCARFEVNNNGTEEELRSAVRAIGEQIQSGNFELLKMADELPEEELEEMEEFYEAE